jgi:hypothetical protein
MINLHDAIYALNSSIVMIHGSVAYDHNDQVVQYDLGQAQEKLVELQNAEISAQQATAAAKASALAKLTALGLTQAEVQALVQ